MKAPGFWADPRPGLVALLLSPLGWIYGALTLRRMAQPGRRVDVPVICIGNFTAGGAGKTPTAIALARALTERGETPVFLTRGYGGTVRELAAVLGVTDRWVRARCAAGSFVGAHLVASRWRIPREYLERARSDAR